MKPTLTLLTALLLAPLTGLHAADEDLALNYHLMHPGGDSAEGQSHILTQKMVGLTSQY
jgi:hypothetical protein